MLRFILWLGLIAILSFTFTSSTDAQRVDKNHSPLGARANPVKLKVTNFGAGMVSGSFTTGGYTIYFEAVRGEANQSGDPDAPPYGMDIRVMDWNYTPFLIQSANSTPLLSSWANDEKSEDALLIDASERLRAFGMLPAAAKSLKTYAEQKKEAQSDLDQSDLKQVIDLLESVKSKDLQDDDAIPDAPSAVTTYTHKAFIMRKDAVFNGTPADHSAVLLKIYSSGGTLVKTWYSCNHGTCANSSLMYSKCFTPFVKSNTSTYASDTMCDSWSPYTYWNPGFGHVCNNDTRQQYLSIKGSSIQNWGVCSFNSATLLLLYRRAPNCD